MPEIVTKYPQILLKELRDAGGKCGVGAPQQILKNCPHDQFCALPTGEICVYDITEVHSMTQISPAEWAEVVTGIPAMHSASNLIVLVIIFGIGLLAGMKLASNPK